MCLLIRHRNILFDSEIKFCFREQNPQFLSVILFAIAGTCATTSKVAKCIHIRQHETYVRVKGGSQNITNPK